MADKIEVHDPRGFPPNVVGKRLANRLDRLEGKNVYLVDCLFDNSEEFMHQFRDWFGQQLPTVSTEMISPRESWTDDPEMRNAIANDGDAAILGVGL